MFVLTSDVLQGIEQHAAIDMDPAVHFDIILASGATWEQVLEHAVISRDCMDPISIHELRGELYDLAEADLRVQFNKAYQAALQEST